jgi:type II secretory pathway pseudopilin PulG
MKRTLILAVALLTSVAASGDDAMLQNQKLAMADLRTLALSIEAFATDNNHYPNATLEELKGLLSPGYVKTVPMADQWGTAYLYVADGQDRYRFVSAGADRKFEESSRTLGASQPENRATDDPAADIIFEDGMFIQYPSALTPKPRQRQE